jgi:cytoskeletal protein CcmA (bactofilin family)
MNQTRKFLFPVALVALLVLTIVTPARAFDGRSGDRVVVGADEVVDDDLYVGAEEFVLDGQVNGDLIAAGGTVTINGTVDGDLMAAAQTVVVNGEVTGAIRMAGSVLFVGEEASIGGDIIGVGYSLEVQQGSTIGQDLIFGGGQILLAGDVARNVQAGTSAFELRGTVGGNVDADVPDTGDARRGPPTLFMPQPSIPVPNVPTGLTIDPAAQIEGDLGYTQSTDLALPAGVVAGEVTRKMPSSDGSAAAREQTTGQKVGKWALGFVRSSITLILIGLLLLWLFPAFVRGLSAQLQARPLPSLGWGVVTWVGFFLALMLVVGATILGAILFGVLTLGQLTGTVIGLGLLTLLGLIIGFILVTTFVAKIVFGAALGKWTLTRLNSPLAEHRYWPMIVGVLLTAAVIALLSFPLIPGFLGGLLNFAVVLLGLGALWLWGRERMARRTAVPATV